MPKVKKTTRRKGVLGGPSKRKRRVNTKKRSEALFNLFNG